MKTSGGQPNVLIVGAGPTGLALATQLQAMGASLRIVDRQLDAVHESRALAVQPRTLEVLRGVGISQTLVERGNDAVQLRIHFAEHLVRVDLDIGADDTAYPFLLFVSQTETEAVMNEHLAAHAVGVERGVELVDFAAREEEVTCTLRHHDGKTERVHPHYLVGCDGARSTVRDGSGIPFEGAAYPQTFALADLEVDGELEPDAAHSFVGAGGMLFFFPLGRPATWRMAAMKPQGGGPGEDAQEATKLSLDELQAIADPFMGGRLRLRDPVWLSEFRIHRRQAARYRAGRVFLAGDAAHVHSPAGAQGMNTGIQDAWNLGWKLALVAKGLADEALLDSYELERWPIGHSVLRFTDRASSIAISDSPFVRAIRTHVAPRMVRLILRFDRVRAFGFRKISQLDIRYRRSPAVQEGQPRLGQGPRAGDRLPDAPIVREGESAWLQEALAAPTFQLLLCGPADRWDFSRLAALREHYPGLVEVHRLSRQAAPEILCDPDGTAFHRLRVKQTAQYLMRPDGHVAFRCGGTDLGDLERYLARWLSGGRTNAR
jgi:2-polyprenyl-6-methoxyphenol hydroxylase-like FAD-dependent oxidoreductase